MPRPLPSVHCAVLDGEAVLHDTATGRSLLLNAAATSVWGLLGALSVADITQRLATEHAVDPEQVGDDLLRVLEQLEAAGVLERS